MYVCVCVCVCSCMCICGGGGWCVCGEGMGVGDTFINPLKECVTPTRASLCEPRSSHSSFTFSSCLDSTACVVNFILNGVEI